MTRYFTDATFVFLEDLADNNDRDWFKANQDRFEAQLREPALAFIEDFGAPLLKISPHLVADPRKVGGSLFRIQRDTRFGKDKTPYKTHLGIQFRHVASKDVHAPGLYLHLDPGGSYAGVGLWRPATDDAYAIRQAIADDPAGWKRAAYGKKFTETFDHGDPERLVRVPRGFDPEHPFIEDIKRKDFTAGTRLTKKVVTSPDFLREYTSMCRTAGPFLRFLCGAVGVAF